MTAAEWPISDDPEAVLLHVFPLASERKLRLLACACARLVWSLLPEGVLREAVEAGERHADGMISDHERKSFVPKLYSPWAQSERPATWFGGPAWGDRSNEQLSAFMVAKLAVASFPALAKIPPGLGWREALRLIGPRIPDLARDVFGCLSAGAASFDPTWRTAEAITLASHVYQDRAFASLPELADLLAAAGCANKAILSHCRGEGPHVRGCWAVDLCLGLS